MKTLTIAISDEDAALLEVLAARDDGDHALDLVVHDLIHFAADGVRRPGSWERGWVAQAFGDEFVRRLEPDPAAEWFYRPRRPGGEP